VREKELRLALVCYGGISLAVYMHGVTKEIWHLAKASRAFHAGEPPEAGSEQVYRGVLEAMARQSALDVRVLVDILAGASAGGINAIFLGEAIAAGRSLDPLTELWLDAADVDRLLDPEVSRVSRLAKSAAVPLAWLLSAKRGGTVDRTVEPAHREEIRSKVANFVRARWFSPPFSGKGFTGLLLSAFDAMAAGPQGPPLLPDYQPLDLFVTVTDFRGYPERLRLNSPPEVVEQEHRLILSFRREGAGPLADPAELVFAARATASFPGAFPPFQVTELDSVLADRGQDWTGREAFLAAALPRQSASGEAEETVLIDGSVLANAPFRPAIRALQGRPARRDVDRRFVYIDPKPGLRSVRLGGGGTDEAPGFFATIFGAMSDIPREQPIRDNLEAIDQRSATVRRLRLIVEAMRPEVEAAIERTFGSTLLLLQPTPKRLSAWRSRAQAVAAREAGYAYAAYGHLKLATVVEDVAERLFALSGGGDPDRREAVRHAVWAHARALRLTAPDAMSGGGARPDVVLFFRNFDLGFRVRRLRFLLRRLGEIEEEGAAPGEPMGAARGALYRLISRYSARVAAEDSFPDPAERPAQAIAALESRLDLRAADDEADGELTAVLAAFPKGPRRSLILAYLGFPFYDIATLPLLQGEGLDEFNEIKVDRISPEDASALRKGGTEATLKGIQFNSFGAFFSRAYRENDYLWGRLHGAERLIEILLSTLPEGMALPEGLAASAKRDAFRAILAQERPRLSEIGPLFEELERALAVAPAPPPP
jgi:patatin-related protein